MSFTAPRSRFSHAIGYHAMLTPAQLQRIAVHEAGHLYGLHDAGVLITVAARIIVRADGSGRFNNGHDGYGTPTQHIIMLCAAHEAEEICGVNDGGQRFDGHDQKRISEIAAAAGLSDVIVETLRRIARGIIRSRRREILQLSRQITRPGTWWVTVDK